MAFQRRGREKAPFKDELFPPRLIMRHQQELGISDSQRSAIVAEIQKFQGQSVQSRWQLGSMAEQLEALVRPSKIDEGKALAQAEKLMNLEREMKRAHLSMLIRVKNILSEEQQKKLKELRPSRGERLGRRHGELGHHDMDDGDEPDDMDG